MPFPSAPSLQPAVTPAPSVSTKPPTTIATPAPSMYVKPTTDDETDDAPTTDDTEITDDDHEADDDDTAEHPENDDEEEKVDDDDGDDGDDDVVDTTKTTISQVCLTLPFLLFSTPILFSPGLCVSFHVKYLTFNLPRVVESSLSSIGLHHWVC